MLWWVMKGTEFSGQKSEYRPRTHFKDVGFEAKLILQWGDVGLGEGQKNKEVHSARAVRTMRVKALGDRRALLRPKHALVCSLLLE